MSRRSTRKRGPPASLASVDEQSSSSASKPKYSRKSARTAVVWEWEGDGGKWNTYDASLSQELADALLKGDDDISLQVASGVKMKVRFSSMTQMNVRTGWQRNVRCVLASGSGGSAGVWEWQDENEKWNTYSPTIQRLLEACDLCGVEKREFEAAGRNYRIDLSNKKQVDVDTSVERKVRCDGKGAEVEEQLDCDDVTTDTTNSLPIVPTTRRSSSNARAKKKGASVSVAHEDDIMEGTSSSGIVETTDSHVIVTNKGKVPVDYECTQKIGKAHVYCEDGEHWDAMLNQTNLKNNNNKFYILQLLEDNSSSRYNVWFRWGRVGKTGQHTFQTCGSDLEQAKQLFKKKFYDKTVNEWEDRGSFVKHAGKYDLLAMDYKPKEEDETDQGAQGDDEVDAGEEVKTEVKPPLVSKLDKRLQAFIELICNVKEMEDTVIEMKFDIKKAPLGKLTGDQIRLGYQALKKIEDCIDRNHFGDQLVQACDAFYTRIPHSFGMQRPPLIRTGEQVKEKIALLEALGDIQIAMKVLSGGKKDDEHPVDRHYRGLKCQLSPVEREEEIFDMIEKYVQQTHAKTHNQYRMEVREVFAVDKDEEEASFKDVGNRQLLWHGSRLTNWVGILSQGLRIAPPEAPVTGYMFGKGVYFADMCSKSANYCFASKVKNEGIVILCEVALGTTNDLLVADCNADKLPRGKDSTKGLGRIAPDPAQTITLPDGCVVPLGTSVDTGVHNPLGYTLNYNEFVVYNTRQLKMKYLVKLKFHFK